MLGLSSDARSRDEAGAVSIISSGRRSPIGGLGSPAYRGSRRDHGFTECESGGTGRLPSLHLTSPANRGTQESCPWFSGSFASSPFP
jgi:hypothetical protein